MIPFLARTACPACGGRGGQERIFLCGYDSPPISTYLQERYPRLPLEELQGKSFEIMRCATCSLMYHREVIEDFYSNPRYKKWDASAYKTKAMNRGQLYYAFLNNFLAACLITLNALRGQVVPPRTVRLLDHGCGAGEFLAFATAYGLHCHGYDPDPAKEALLRERGMAHIGEAGLDAPSCEGFDIIHSNMVFEHLLSPRKALRRLARVLAPKGVLRIGVPDAANMEDKIHVPENWHAALKGSPRTTNPIWPFGHRNCFCERTMRVMADDAGLRLLDPSELEAYPEFEAQFPFRPLVRLGGQFFFTTRDGADA